MARQEAVRGGTVERTEGGNHNCWGGESQAITAGPDYK